jgi:hypothetical protein
MKASARSKIRVALVGFALAALLSIHFYGAQLGMIGFMADHFLPGIVSSKSYERAVMHPDRDDAYSAYGVLGKRRSPVARDIAMQQLHSEDGYLWLNAARYLGCIREPAAVPYLIKAFRHTAWRADEERRQLLTALTGKDFGTDFAKWRQWWVSQHPDFQIDWDSHLGFNPRVPKRQTPNTSLE